MRKRGFTRWWTGKRVVVRSVAVGGDGERVVSGRWDHAVMI